MKRWSIKVELTWDIKPEDEEVRVPGDSVRDFGRRGFERVRHALELLKEEGFAHYHILEEPKQVIDA